MSEDELERRMFLCDPERFAFDFLLRRIQPVSIEDPVAHRFRPFGHSIPIPELRRIVDMIHDRQSDVFKITEHRVISGVVKRGVIFPADSRLPVHHFDPVEAERIESARLVEEVGGARETRFRIIKTGESGPASGGFQLDPGRQEIIRREARAERRCAQDIKSGVGQFVRHVQNVLCLGWRKCVNM